MPKLVLSNNQHANALFLAHCSNASYAKNPRKSASFKKTNLLAPTIIENDDKVFFGDRGFVAESPDGIVIALQGTNDALDWIKNLQFEKQSFLGSKVHSGFLKGMKSVKNSIQAALDKITDWKTKRIYVTGHSRGGAISILLTKHLWRAFGSELDHAISVFCFGCPRVGAPGFFDSWELGATTFLYINGSDPIPALPPQLDEFVHIAEQLVLHDGTVSKLDIDTIAGFIERKQKTSVLPDMADHKIVNYLKSIESLV